MNLNVLTSFSSKTKKYTPDHLNQCVNLVDLLSYRAYYQPHQPAFTFLQNGETELVTLTYQELHRQAQAIATQLQPWRATGARALLLYPSGVEFIAAFFGCLYAGVIAVPAYPPRRNQSIDRLQTIVADSQAKVALTTASLLTNIQERIAQEPEFSSLLWLATDNLDSTLASDWQQPQLSSDTVAFLQYTSGSTGKPKGVMVTHNNLVHNCQLIHQSFGHSAKSQGVIWLPLYHDMGLIGGVLQPLYGGFPVTLMSPVDFLQKPLRWLQTISQSQATTSGGPNFAYELCVNKITAEQKANLDLSSWEVAFTGAEPIRAQTLEHFAQAFAECGFRWEAFYPCYGMAEATLFVSGGRKPCPPVLLSIEEAELEQNRVMLAKSDSKSTRTLVGCGYSASDQEIVIVDPESLKECPPDQVGEIWLSGASVAQGYWQQPTLTQAVFQSYLAETREGPFLRTGDLGFVKAGELFVTGRLKDVIIIRGCNHYPQDIELTVEQSHSALIPHHSAAFTVEVAGEERLIVVAEVERRYRERRQNSEKFQGGEQRQWIERRQENLNPGFEVKLDEPLAVEAVVGNIRQAVSANHGLQVYGVLLLRVGSIPKTSSGKIQRYACRKGFLEKSLNVVYMSPSL